MNETNIGTVVEPIDSGSKFKAYLRRKKDDIYTGVAVAIVGIGFISIVHSSIPARFSYDADTFRKSNTYLGKKVEFADANGDGIITNEEDTKFLLGFLRRNNLKLVEPKHRSALDSDMVYDANGQYLSVFDMDQLMSRYQP